MSEATVDSRSAGKRDGTAYSRAEAGISSPEVGVSSPSSPEILFRTHYRSLVQSLTLIAGGDEDVAAEVVGDAFIELERRWDKIGGYDDPVSWIRRVALNRFLNHRRSLARRAQALLRLERRESDLPDRSGISEASHPSNMTLREALRRLPLKQRTAVVLFYFADLSTADVARAMDISEGAVNQHLHRAREALRKELEVND